MLIKLIRTLPSYVQTTDHQTSDINEFTDHLKKLKEVVARLSIEEFKTMLIDESQNTIFYAMMFM